MPLIAPPLRAAALALLCAAAPLPARAAPKLPPAAEAALSSAEKLLGKTTGDERVVACFDAVSFLEIVYRWVPDYAYATGLYGECLYLTDSCEVGARVLERYLSLVPQSARKGAVAEKVARAQERLTECRARLGLGNTPVQVPIVVKDPAQPSEQAPVEVKPPEQPPVEVKPPEQTPSEPAKSDEFVLPPEDQPQPPPAPAPAKTPWPLQLALRAGYGPLAGVVGLSGEARWGPVGLVLGTGAYPFAAGLSFGSARGEGGLYVDLHAVRTSSSLLVERAGSGLGVGVTAGWDWRPLPILSVKAGLGGGWVLGDGRLQGGVITGDLMVGPVFSL